MDDYNSLESNREDTETISSLFLVYFLWLPLNLLIFIRNLRIDIPLKRHATFHSILDRNYIYPTSTIGKILKIVFKHDLNITTFK